MASVPTTTHERPGSAANGARRSVRHRIGPLVYLDLGSSNGGFPINVSEEGLRFQGIQRVSRDQLLTIKFKLPDTSSCVDTVGQVVWVNEIGTGGGLRFIDLPKESRQLIQKWISLETLSRSLEPRLEKIEVKSLTQPEPRDAQPISTASISAHESASVTDRARPHTTVVVRGSSLFPAAHAKPTVTPISTRHPLRSTESAPLIEGPQFLRGRRTKRARSTPLTHFMIAGIVIIALGALIVAEFRTGTIFQMVHANIGQPVGAPVINAPSLPSSGAGVRDGAKGDLAAAEPVSKPAAPAAIAQPLPDAPVEEKRVVQSPLTRPAAVRASVKPAAPKPAAKQLTAFSKALAPKTFMTPAVTPDAIPPPALAMLPQPTSLRPTLGLPEPPAPTASRPVQSAPNLEAAQILVRREPQYPEFAKANRTSGSVDLLFTIGADGMVHNIRIAKGNNLLAHAAIEAVKGWRFQPARRDGIPVESESSTVVTFKLN